MKKLLMLFASPHESGCTKELLNSFLKHFPEGWERERIDVFDADIRPCVDCGFCAEKEGCVFSDLDGFDRALRECDLLVIASPVYNYSFPAPMKALLDRTQRYFCARFSLGKKPPVKKRRKAALLLTMGSREAFGAEVCEHQLKRAFSVMNTELAGTVVADGTDREKALSDAKEREVESLALEILSCM